MADRTDRTDLVDGGREESGVNGRHVSLQCGYWADPDLAGWSPLARLLYLWLWTCDHVNGVTGVGQAAVAVICAQTGMTEADIEYAIREIGERVRWFGPGRWWVVARARHTCYTADGRPNPKLAASAARQVAGMKPEIRAAFVEAYPDLASAQAFEGLAGAGGTSAPRREGDQADQDPGQAVAAPRDWDSWEVAAVVAESPTGWRDGLIARAQALMKHEPARALATILDVAGARDRPEDAGQAMERVFGRLRGNRPPSDRHYQDAKQKLAARARRAAG